MSNHIPRYSQAVILEALHTFGEDGRGRNGIIGLIHRAIREDVKHAIHLLVAITPKLLEHNITRTEVHFTTIEQLDAELAKQGLPPTQQIFAVDFRGTPASDVAESEVIEPDSTTVSK
jgi:hypothetical protein